MKNYTKILFSILAAVICTATFAADKPTCKKTGKNCPMNDNKECNCGKSCDCYGWRRLAHPNRSTRPRRDGLAWPAKRPIQPCKQYSSIAIANASRAADVFLDSYRIG